MKAMTPEEIVDNMPPGIDREDLIALLATIMTMYVKSAGEAQLVLGVLIRALKEHYDEQPDDCMCEKCVAERKRSAN